MHTTNHLNAALAGTYAIERELGRGGMATVFLARDIKHQRQVALKVLDPELGAVLGAERFLSEIRVTANLQLTVVKREALFTDNNRGADGDGGRWDVFPNGREFLFAKAAHRPETTTLYVLVNWQRLLGRTAPQNVTP
jgi:serine/threonine protein kinase